MQNATHDLWHARVSTEGQSVDAQVGQLTKAGCKQVFRGVASGAKTDRAQLRRLLGQLEVGDVLTMTRLDRGRKQLSSERMSRQDARRMIVRRALQAGIITKLGCHTFRATGITVYLLNGGLLEYAQQMAAHESARTTKLYDRRNDQVTLDQVERIVL